MLLWIDVDAPRVAREGRTIPLSSGDLGGVRGRLISTPDRRKAIELIDEARASGARLKQACEVLGISTRTYQRWQHEGGVPSDARSTAMRPKPAHALSEAEEQAVVDLCNRPEYQDLPPAQIVAQEADDGRYWASESTLYRVLRKHKQAQPRGRGRKGSTPPPPTSHRADGPNQVWSWDTERHEALSDRVTVRDRHDSAVAVAGDKLRAARTGERQQGWQAALTKPGRGSIVRCRGSGEQMRKV